MAVATRRVVPAICPSRHRCSGHIFLVACGPRSTTPCGETRRGWTGGVNSRWAGLALTATLVAGVMAGFALSRQPFSGWTDRGVASAEAESGPGVEFADAGGGVARPESWTSVADPEWAMVLLMAETARWDGREATAIFVADGAADRAIFELSAEERLELKRLIELEIGANEAEAS